MMYGGHISGEVIGNKTLVEYRGLNPHRHHLWTWIAPCCRTIRGPSTLAHLRRSARCLECSYLRENNGRWRGFEQLTGKWFTQRQRDARLRGLSFNVSMQDLWTLWLSQRGCCAYTGRQLTHGIDASLDRRDNAIGYEPGNVQWVHRDINRMKTDLAEADFISLCKQVALMADFARESA